MKNCNKEKLWSVLEKYDNHSDYKVFCNSISKFIQEKETSDDVFNVFKHLTLIDNSDKKKIEITIGNKIDNLFFSF